MTRIAAWLIGVAAVGLPTAAWAPERPGDRGWQTMGGVWGAWGIGKGRVFQKFWVLVIVALIAGIRWLATQGRESRTDTALEILRQRYARGEINRDEFDAKKRDLS